MMPLQSAMTHQKPQKRCGLLMIFVMVMAHFLARVGGAVHGGISGEMLLLANGYRLMPFTDGV